MGFFVFWAFFSIENEKRYPGPGILDIRLSQEILFNIHLNHKW